MSSVEAPICFETNHGCLDDVPAAFVVNIETWAEEPYSWGESRGVSTEFTSVTLESVKLGGYWMPRETFERWVGTDEIDRIERHALNHLNDNLPEYLEAAE